MAVLAGVKGPMFGRQFRLQGECSLIGRHPECDFVLQFPHVSRRHAQILLEAGEYFVENLDRRQRTFVNGKLVTGRCRLGDKDQLRICDLLFTFYYGEAPECKLAFAEPDLDVLSTVDMKPPRETTPLPPDVAKSKLEAMVRIGRHVGNALRLDDALPKVLDCLFLIFPAADRAFVMLCDPLDGSLSLKAVRRRTPDAPDSMAVSLSLIERVIAKREAVLSADRAPSAGGGATRRKEGGALMCVPLLDTLGRALGVVQVDAVTGRFVQVDLDLLAGVAWQIALAIENARLHEKLLRQQELEFDLQITREVRHKLLPQARPVVSGYEFFDFYQPGAQVGGDFYDYHRLSEGRLAVIMADFWGKGVAAALCMAKLIGDVRYELSHDENPAQAMTRINARLCESELDDRYITLILAVLDPQRHTLTVSSAGHLPPLHRPAQGPAELLNADQVGFPLGIDAAHSYQEVCLPLSPGDAVVLYSDGIREAVDIQETVYGMERLRKLLIAPAGNATELGQRIADDVRRFVGEQPHRDDMCLICFRRAE